MSFFTRLYKKVDNVFARFFSWYGRKVGTYPWIFITGCILVNGLLGLGLLRLRTESNVEKLYVPQGNQAAKDRSVAQRYFSDWSHSAFYRYQETRDEKYAELIIRMIDRTNVLDEIALNETDSVSRKIKAISAFDPTSATSFNYSTVCARRFGACVIDGEFLLDHTFRKAFMDGNITYPIYVHPKIGQLYMYSYLGGVKVKNGKLESAKYLKMRYNLRQDSDNTSRLRELWEKEFLSSMNTISQKMSTIEIGYANSDSLNQEISSNTSGDVKWMSLTFTLMITYASIVASGGNWVSTKGHLARAGVLASALAILSSLGLVSLFRVPFTNIVGVMPFLMLGIGIDDTFIMMSGWSESEAGTTIPSRLSMTLATSGVSITLTSLTNAVAFCIGATSSFLSVRVFCIYTGVAVIFCYLNQVTLFAGCLVIHARRVEQSRHCVTCLPVKSKEEMKRANKSTATTLFCSGEPAISRDDEENICEKFPRKIMTKFLLLFPVKMILFALFLAYLGMSIWGACNLEQGLALRNLVTDTSYYHKYSVWNDEHFETRFPTTFYVHGQVMYHENNTQTLINNLCKEAQDDALMSDTFLISWLDAYQSSSVYNGSSEEAFVENLVNKFLLHQPVFDNDIVFNQNSSRIIACRFHLQSKDLQSSTEQGSLMLKMRALTDQSSLPVFAYSPPFIYFEQYISILPNTLLTVGIAVAAMFVLSAVFLPHPLLVIYMTASMVSILVGVFGFMYLWDLTLSSITMIHLVMSVGFSVDYCAHICHAYMQMIGPDRKVAVIAAITRSGGPILNGAVSSLIGVIMLVFSESYVFRSFFKIMVLVIVFGATHSTLFLPALLSFAGPCSKDDKQSTLQVGVDSARTCMSQQNRTADKGTCNRVNETGRF